MLDADGEPIGRRTGPPTLLESWIDGQPPHAYEVADGRGPEADDEMALNVAAANDGDFEVGDTVTLVTQLGSKEYTLVGTVLFGTAESSAGAVSVEFTLAEVQRLAGTDGRRSRPCWPGAEEGVSQEELVERIAARCCPDDVEVITGEEAAAQLSVRRAGGLRLLPAGAHDLRVHRPARRRLRHLQHLLDPLAQRTASSRSCGRSAPAEPRCSGR